MPVPEILYRLTWSWPDDPETEQRALVNHMASMDLARVLEARGAVVDRCSMAAVTGGSGRDDVCGPERDHMDASDRETMARLAQRAFGRWAD